MKAETKKPLKKDFPVFDCDAHVTESPDHWNYLTEKEREEIRPWYYPEGSNLMVNGSIGTINIWNSGRMGSTWGKPRGPAVQELGAAPEPESVAFWNAKHFSERAKKASNAGRKFGDVFGSGGFGGGSMF